MRNGNINEFVDHIYYGDELWFVYKNTKYFLEGLCINGINKLRLYEIKENGAEYSWSVVGHGYPAESFLNAKIFDGKTFWEVEKEIEWVDC